MKGGLEVLQQITLPPKYKAESRGLSLPNTVEKSCFLIMWLIWLLSDELQICFFFFFFCYKIWKCIWFNPMLLCTHFNRFPFTCFSVKYTDLFPYLNIMQSSHLGAGMCSLHYCCAFRLRVGTPSFSAADDMVMYLKVSSSFKGKLLPIKLRVKKKISRYFKSTFAAVKFFQPDHSCVHLLTSVLNH